MAGTLALSLTGIENWALTWLLIVFMGLIVVLIAFSSSWRWTASRAATSSW